MVVRDPDFWRRFSVAVHQDDLAREQRQNQPHRKHSYVSFLSPASPPPAPGPAWPISPVCVTPTPMAGVTALPSSRIPTSLFSAGERHGSSSQPGKAGVRFQTTMPPKERHLDSGSGGHQAQTSRTLSQNAPKRRPSKLQKSPSTHSTAPLLSFNSSTSTPTASSPLPPAPPPKDTATPKRPADTQKQTPPKNQNRPSITLPPPTVPPATRSRRRPSSPRMSMSRYSFRCPSSLSLALAGRSRTHFRTWTTITGGADAKHRESWLENENKKRKQRVWICWFFWIALVGMVGGAVVSVLVLKAHGML